MWIEEKSVRATIDLIYESAVDGSRWQDAVHDICSLFKASRTCFAQFDPVDRSFEHISTENDPEAVRQLKTFQTNIMLETACEAPIGEIYHDRARIGGDRIERSEFWNEWARPRDMYGSLTTKIHAVGSTFWFLDLQRGRNSPAFDDDDALLLKRFVPHVLRAGRLSQRFQAKQTLDTVFRQLPFGLLIVDGDQYVLAQNDAARAILNTKGSGLDLKGNRLLATEQPNAERLSGLIRKTCTPALDGTRFGGGDLLLSCAAPDDAQVTLALSVAPLNGTTIFGTKRKSCAAIFIKEIRQVLPAQFETYLQTGFDLSRSEARLATELANGKSLKDIAGEAGLQIKTARTYLDRVFRKTGTHQQSQLVALLRSAVPFRMN